MQEKNYNDILIHTWQRKLQRLGFAVVEVHYFQADLLFSFDFDLSGCLFLKAQDSLPSEALPFQMPSLLKKRDHECL